MRFKNVREKITFIDSLENMDNESVKKYISILSMLACDKNIDVRLTLARQLVLFDSDEIEEILYGMLFDQNRLVRLEAIDSISIGRHEKSIEKVQVMLREEGFLIRMYAVATLFDLITNAYGMNEKAFGKYNQIVQQSFQIERNPYVLLSYHKNEYYMHREKGWLLLRNSYTDELDNEKYDLIWTILHTFEEIKNKDNYSELMQVVDYKVEKLSLDQKTFIEELHTKKVPYKVLILDEDNVFLSHIIALLLCSICRKEDIFIDTAGIGQGILNMNDIKVFCKLNNISCPEKLCSKRITSIYEYDYIICFNTMIDPEMYSEIKVLYYNNVDFKDKEQLMLLCVDIKTKLFGQLEL